MIAENKNILIVEDEVLIAQYLKKSIVDHGYNCAGIAINYNAAELLLKTTKVDLVLLDIKISGTKTGLDLAESINTNYKIPFIFITSFSDKSTLDAIKKLSPKGYLNKPVNDATLLTTIDIIFASLHKLKTINSTINIGTSTYTINISELLYVSSEHVYVRLYYKTRTILIRSALINFMDLLPKDSLIQISRGTVINPNYIEKVSSSSVKIKGEDLKLSTNYRQNLIDFLNY